MDFLWTRMIHKTIMDHFIVFPITNWKDNKMSKQCLCWSLASRSRKPSTLQCSSLVQDAAGNVQPPERKAEADVAHEITSCSGSEIAWTERRGEGCLQSRLQASNTIQACLSDDDRGIVLL